MKMIKATLQFDNGYRGNWRSPMPSRGWVVRKVFNDEAHMENFIAYIERKTGMPLDNLYIDEQ
jgi:hypothetical protein